jgi:predicted AlkP superfamily phosphohydrolase/phosphomutase
MSVHGLDITAIVSKSASSAAYNRMQFFLGGDTPVADLSEGQWSLWIPVVLQGQDIEINSEFKLKIIKIWPDGNFRVRVLFNTLNRFVSAPGSAAEFLSRGVGQMVDYADSSPQQLIFEPEDQAAFEDEMRLSFEWHKKAVPFIMDRTKTDIFIHSMYSPGQMLESRWWMRELDGAHKDEAAKDILSMYQEVDAVLGEALKKAGKDTLVVLSADHGMCPLRRLVHLNNFFAKKGWLKFNVDKKTGDATIDWKKTKVAYLNSHQIFISPTGLGGEWKRGKGPKYEKLRLEVMKAVQGLKDDKGGAKPVVHSVKWEDAKGVYDLPQDRVGDLILEARVNYAWDDSVDKSKRVFSDSLTSGSAQAIDPKINSCLWTPFAMWGPGVKKGVEIAAPISHADQLPTFLQLLGIAAPEHIQGKVLSEAIN